MRIHQHEKVKLKDEFLLLPVKESGSSQIVIESAGQGSVIALARSRNYVQVDKIKSIG